MFVTNIHIIQSEQKQIMKIFNIVHKESGKTLRQHLADGGSIRPLNCENHIDKDAITNKVKCIIGENGTPGFYWYDKGWYDGHEVYWLSHKRWEIRWIENNTNCPVQEYKTIKSIYHE